MTDSPFCIARVGELVRNPDDGQFDVEFVHTELSTTEAVIDFLKDVYDRFANLLADENAERSEDERTDLSEIGGFGVQLTNRFGGEIEFGLGRRQCVLIRLEPSPIRIYRNPIQGEGTLVFYLDGWHYTEFNVGDLAPREDCLNRLETWLESNDFPDEA